MKLLHLSLGLAVAAIAAVGCFNFDAKYDEVVGRLDGGTAGGDGGGTGGGVAGGAGGGAAGGTVDAGCDAYLCAVDVFKTTRGSDVTSPGVVPGLVAEAPDRYVAYASFDTGGTVAHVELKRLPDGGLLEISRAADFGLDQNAIYGNGVSVDDFWFGGTAHAVHYVGGNKVSSEVTCALSDGGVAGPYFWGVNVKSADEVWLVGRQSDVGDGQQGVGLCLWTPDAGSARVYDPVTHPDAYAYAAYRTPSGEVFVAGGDYSSGADSYIYLLDGGLAASPVDHDDDGYGYCDIDGAGETVWAVSRTGRIIERKSGQTFTEAFKSTFSLRDLHVRGPNDVWAVGFSGNRAVHFDGGSWGYVDLPSSKDSPEIVWERIIALPTGLVLSGFQTPVTGQSSAVIHSYRFGQP